MGIMSLILSGDNESLDSTDALTLLTNKIIKVLKHQLNLYSLSVHTGNGEIKTT